MSNPSEDWHAPAWRPGPELLSAYFDGELSGRPELEAMRHRIQDWLRAHPEARAELVEYRVLDQLWEDTAPADPGSDAWRRFETRLERARCSPTAPARRAAVGQWAALLLASAAAIALVVWVSLSQTSPRISDQPHAQHPAPAPTDDVEVFAVATAAEITILHVAGADTQTVAVGEMPVQGLLELAGPGEVALTSVQPAAGDHMIPNVRIGGTLRPMIWAPFAAEDR